jgi:squalene monooxygenase
LQYHAPLTLVADGCFSKFRKELIPRTPVAKSHFVGLILKNLTLPFPNHGHVILADPSPILLYQIGSNETRILVDIPGKLPSIGNGDLKQYMKEFVGPQLPESIRDSFYKAVEVDRLRSMPCSWLPPIFNPKSGVVAIGDAINMRHPLTGGKSHYLS